MIDKTLCIPIYDVKLRVAICDDNDGFEQTVYDTGYTEDLRGAGAIALRHPGTSLFQVIMLRESLSPGSIAHEALHITNRIMELVDIKYDCHNDECMCYLHAFVVDGIHQIINSHEDSD